MIEAAFFFGGAALAVTILVLGIRYNLRSMEKDDARRIASRQAPNRTA